MPTLLINQPGRFGDILVCLPIAEYYSDLFDVFWLCPKQYHPLFRNIDYCTPTEVVPNFINETIDLSFGLVKDGPVHEWWMKTCSSWSSYVEAKYHLAKVDLERRWSLHWNRDLDRESALLALVRSNYSKDYNVVHDTTWNYKRRIDAPNKVTFQPVEDFNIFDWYQVLLHANSVHCIDSSLCNFVEVLPEFAMIPKYYYKTKRDFPTIIRNNWGVIP